MNRLQRERTPLSVILMIVLWIMATPDSFRSVARQFGVRPATVHYHYLYIIEALRELSPRYIVWPNARERRITKEYFEEATGFPGVIGCIDGTHINIIAPRVEPMRYVNRHHNYSMNVQCVCDHRLVIIDLYVGECGSVPDSRVYRRSPLCGNLLGNDGFIDFDEHILGEGGYILLNSVLTPFRNNGNLSDEQINYGRMHSQVRGRVENCFGRKKGMWRRLKYLHATHPEIVIGHIVATAVLHNFIILNGEEVNLMEEGLGQPIEDGELGEEELEDDEEIVGQVDYPNVMAETDDPRMEEAKELGVEKRLHVMRNLPRVYR